MSPRKRVAVVVVGDFGRSPRMQYHAISLAETGRIEVDVVAHQGAEPHAAIMENKNIHLHLLSPGWTASLPRVLYLLALPLKAVVQFVTLLWTLCVTIPAPDVFLVQNPPSVPALGVVKLAAWLRGATVVIDWHNFGYTLMGLSLGHRHLFTLLYRWYESATGRLADHHLCVSKAMQHELATNWGISATVLYDRPPEFFHRLTPAETHELFSRLRTVLGSPLGSRDCCTELDLGAGSGAGTAADAAEESDYVLPSRTVETTLVTTLTRVSAEREAGARGGAQGGTEDGVDVGFREGRPAVVVSSTSWSSDEDFSLLLEAAVMYDRRVAAALGEADVASAAVEGEGGGGADAGTRSSPGGGGQADWEQVLQTREGPWPRLLIIVTGKGPQRPLFEERIRRLQSGGGLRRVAFRTLWLAPGDYPRLLGAADLGVSLHTSSSGLDLPMKVVDMFGCGLPVCAVGYSCIGELVQEGVNGLLFGSSSELADQLLQLFRNFPEGSAQLSALRDGALATGSQGRWAQTWAAKFLPILDEVAEGKKRRLATQEETKGAATRATKAG